MFIPVWTEHGASLAAEFFSGGVCHKDSGENCSTEAAVDSRFTLLSEKQHNNFCAESRTCVRPGRVTGSQGPFKFESTWLCMLGVRGQGQTFPSVCDCYYRPSDSGSASLYVKVS